MATKGKINVDFTMRYIGALRANRIVANPNRYSTINYKDIVSYAARAAHVPESSVEVAMDALYDALSYFVLNGHNVKIDGLGTFFFGINAFAEETMEAAGADAVYRLKIGYLPEKDLRVQLNNVAVTTTYSNPGNLAVDTTVPAKISSFASALSQGGTAKKFDFGDSVNIPESGIYLIIKGSQLSKVSEVSATEDIRINEDGEYGQATMDANCTIVARTEKEVVVYIPRWNESENTVDAYLARVYVEYSDNDNRTMIALSSPYAEAPVFADTILFGGMKGGLFTQEEYKKNLQIAALGSSEYMLTFKGANMQLAPSKLTFTGCTFEARSLTSKEARFLLTNVAGQVTIANSSVENNNLYGTPIVISVGQTSTEPVVTSLTANGVSVANGGSSTVQAGQSYNFVFSGANLGSVTQSDLVVPSGATISNFSATASRVQFNLTIGTEGGTIGLNHNGSSMFAMTVTIPTNIQSSVTSIGGVGNNGTLTVTPTQGRVTVAVKGTGLSSLQASNFVMASGYSMELATGSDTERNLTITASSGFAGGNLLVQVDSTTIFTVTLDTGGEVGF